MSVVLGGLVGCATSPPPQAWVSDDIKPGPTRMSQSEVVTAAQQFATERGFRLSHYERPRLSLYLGDEFQPGKVWGLWFWENSPYHPGGYLLINVDDKTGRAELMPSR
jgi:hypothetical protein